MLVVSRSVSKNTWQITQTHNTGQGQLGIPSIFPDKWSVKNVDVRDRCLESDTPEKLGASIVNSFLQSQKSL